MLRNVRTTIRDLVLPNIERQQLFLKFLVWLCIRQTKVLPVSRHNDTFDKKVVVLALNPGRFRGDLECLVSQGNFKILKAPIEWQSRFVSWFYKKPLRPINAHQTEEGKTAQSRSHIFLAKFLELYYRALKVNLVVSAGAHYEQDYDWATVSSKLGVPHTLFHRENLYAAPALQKLLVERMQQFPKFWGNHIIVHNQMMRDLFIKSGFVEQGKITSAGCLRMDSYLKAVAASNTASWKQITLFSFGPGASVGMKYGGNAWLHGEQKGFWELCRKTHLAFVEIAKENSDIEVVIKPKWGGSWIRQLDQLIAPSFPGYQELPNLVIDAELDSQKLIMESAAICGFGSTTLLEAAIADKTVIVPHFAEVHSPNYQDFVIMQDDYDIFDVATSEDDLKARLLASIHMPVDQSPRLQRRQEVFEKYVSPLDADAIGRYSAILLEQFKQKTF